MSKRWPPRQKSDSEGLIPNIPLRTKPERGGTKNGAPRPQAGRTRESPSPEHLTRPFQRALKKQIDRHAERNPFKPPTPPAVPSPEPQPNPVAERREPERNGERGNEDELDEEMRRLIAEVRELDEEDQELFRQVMLESRPDTESPPNAEPHAVRLRRRKGTTASHPGQTAKAHKPLLHIPAILKLLPTHRIQRPGPPLDSSQETTVQMIWRLPGGVVREIRDGNVDRLDQVKLLALIVCLLWILRRVIVGDEEADEVH